MTKLTDKQIAFAKDLLKKHPGETHVYVKLENGHMYFSKQNALTSVGNDEKKLAVVTAQGADEAGASGEGESTQVPLTEMKYTALKAYADANGIALDPSDTSQAKVLAKIQEALAKRGGQ